MHFTPTIFMAQLLAAMQVLMILDMPLRSSLALPVTSKPIESTVENLAWQAWIELPPEQKQQVKSRKVTPKSIFTLPLRVECPAGHKQVDTKCIPIVIGSNDVLIDLNALGLLVGNTQTDELYDYDDIGEEIADALPYGSEMPVAETEKSVDGITVDLKPPSKDEPLKFNIFQNKFDIFHEEPLEDYSALSNEGILSAELEKEKNVESNQANNVTAIETINTAAINDLLGEASNISNNFEISAQTEKGSTSSSSSDRTSVDGNILATLPPEDGFKVEAISLPASGYETHQPNKMQIIQNDIQLVTTLMDTETTTAISKDTDKQPENDLQTLLRNESFLPIVNQTTLQELPDTGSSSSLTTVALEEQNKSSTDVSSLQLDDEEITTFANEIINQEMPLKDKQEFTRSVTINPSMSTGIDSDGDDNDAVKDSTLESVMYDELLETTTPIQLDETTALETSSFSNPSLSTQQELKELLLLQERVQKDFEELQRLRKGQKDQRQQHVVLKKSKVEPVKVVSTAITNPREAAAITTTTETTTSNSVPRETNTVKEPIITTTTTKATLTPLLTVHNESDKNNFNNNDRFYYQHFSKPDSQVTQRSDSKLTTATVTEATTASATKTTPLTREINLAEELRIINELVKGIRPDTTLTTTKAMQTSTTSEKPIITSTTIESTDEISTSSTPSGASESSTITTKPTPSTLQIWSKIMPLLTTTTNRSLTNTQKSFIQNQSHKVDTSESSSSATRSNRNTTTTNAEEYFTPSSTTIASSSRSSSNQETSTNSAYGSSYWWLPVAWRLDKPTNSEKQQEEQEANPEEQPLLLRFWSTYHAPRSS